jgi:Phenazine biosynthesis-like protein
MHPNFGGTGPAPVRDRAVSERPAGLPFFVVDAFAERAFAGNPAAVCLLAAWPDDALLLAIAGEMNLSETAFIVGGKGEYDIRWFTPTREVDLIGHATLAAGLVVLDALEHDRQPGSARRRGQPPSPLPEAVPPCRGFPRDVDMAVGRKPARAVAVSVPSLSLIVKPQSTPKSRQDRGV